MDEFERIARFFAPLAGDEGLALQDDAACWTPAHGHDLIISKDMLVEGIHFFRDTDPRDLARKAVRVNISDLVAKGAEPRAYMLGLGLSKKQDDAWLDAFAKSLADDQRHYGIKLIGGDTVATGGTDRAPIVISMTVFGTVEASMMVKRSGARPGDVLVVTGMLGGAATWLKLAHIGATDRGCDRLRRAYEMPEPPVVLAQALRAWAHAAADISDGLIADLGHVLRASDCGADIIYDRVPVMPQALSALDDKAEVTRLALTGGDDYQVVAAVPLSSLDALQSSARAYGVSLTVIGEVKERSGLRVMTGDGRDIAADLTSATAGFKHF